MRKVALAMQVSLDGFVATADDDLSWMWLHFDDQAKASNLEALRRTSTHIMGRSSPMERSTASGNRPSPSSFCAS